jgi:hypothetical protein
MGVVANIKGPSGAAGATGPTGPTGNTGAPGAAGSVWFNGAGAPSDAVGANGDFYLNTTTGDVSKKVGGTWA